MCLNCGCGEPTNDHGKAANITIEELRSAAAANGQTLRESAQHVLDAVDAYERGGAVASMAAPGDSERDLASEGNAGLGRPAGNAVPPPAPHGSPGSES